VVTYIKSPTPWEETALFSYWNRSSTYIIAFPICKSSDKTGDTKEKEKTHRTKDLI
jgi:hypothetical protein